MLPRFEPRNIINRRVRTQKTVRIGGYLTLAVDSLWITFWPSAQHASRERAEPPAQRFAERPVREAENAHRAPCGDEHEASRSSTRETGARGLVELLGGRREARVGRREAAHAAEHGGARNDREFGGGGVALMDDVGLPRFLEEVHHAVEQEDASLRGEQDDLADALGALGPRDDHDLGALGDRRLHARADDLDRRRQSLGEDEAQRLRTKLHRIRD
jgi:hypothetical protein